MKRLSVLLALSLSGCGLYFDDPTPAPGEPGAEPWGAPITGGTMIVTRDDTRAVIADPDRGRIVILDLQTQRVARIFELEPRSEPGRVVEDGAGRIHVGLRSSGELATITGDNLVLQPVCGEPRGVAWEESTDLVHVACATGELVSMPAGGGAPTRVLRLARDLRDVIVRPNGLVVTTFRIPELIEVDATGAVVSRQKLQVLGFVGMATAQPEVAWRTIALPDNRLLMSHQLRLTQRLTTQPGGYGDSVTSAPSCRSGMKIQSSLTVVATDNTLTPVVPIVHDALPVDIAVNATQTEVAVVTVGTRTVKTFPAAKLNNADQGDCTTDSARNASVPDLQGSPTAVAWRPSGSLLAFYPEGPVVQIIGGNTIAIGEPATDLGRSMFHSQTSVGMACASCHPEGRDDGQVWTFEGLGARRTQNIAGGVLGRAPFHWTGDQKDLPTLVHNVFESRMSGDPASEEQIWALAGWLDAIPAPRGVVVDYDAVARGEDLFKSSELGCMSCHNGAQYTNLQLVNVYTGGTMKVPSLIGVGARAPYMHNGCAATLRNRFNTTCGGGDYHGHTSHLTDAELSDLIAFLESL